MKKIISLSLILVISIFLIIYINLYAQKNLNFNLLPLDVKKISQKKYSINCSITYSNIPTDIFDDSKVLITTEKYIISGIVPDYTVKERDILYSKIDLDLNNDNDVDDVYKIKMISDKFYMNNTLLKTIFSTSRNNKISMLRYYDEKNIFQYNQITEKGLPFIIYSIDKFNKNVTIGFNAKEQPFSPIPIEEFPNPNVQILVSKPIDNFNSKIDFSIADEKNYLTYSNEKIFEDHDGWVGIKWAVKTFKLDKNDKSEINFIINDITPPFSVLAFINFSFEKSIRYRTGGSVKIVME